MAANLPSRDEFLQKSLEVITACAICHEPFDAKHTPARIRSPDDKCQHVFGSTCLRRWLESDAGNANTCPCCRAVLFRKHRVPKFTDAPSARAFNPRWLENLTSRYEHLFFVKHLWFGLWHFYHGNNDLITDTDIEECIHEALADVTSDFGLDDLLCVRYEHWPGMQEAAKEMIRAHYQADEFKELTAESFRTIWLPRLEVVLGWKVEIDSDDEEDMDMVD